MPLENILFSFQPDEMPLAMEATTLYKQSDSKEIKDIVWDASELTRTAIHLYRGWVLSSAPSFFWDDILPLPWKDRYFQPGIGTDTIVPIKDEISALLKTLRDTRGSDFPNLNQATTYYSSELMKDDRLKVQGLAVESLLAIDLFVGFILLGKHCQAMPWLSAAYKFLVEALHQALPMASRRDLARQAGGVGGEARAAKLRPLKQWALEQDKLLSKGSPLQRSRQLANKIPAGLRVLSVDPERVVLDTLKRKYTVKF